MGSSLTVATDPVDSISLEERDLVTGRVPAFAALPLAARQMLAGLLREERFAPGSTVVIEGSPGDRLFLLVQGEAEVSTLENDLPIHLARLKPGAVFGELALLEPERQRDATVTAATELFVLTLTAEAFGELTAHYPKALHVLAAHTRRDRATRFLRAHLLYHLHFHDLRREVMFLSSVSFFVSFLVIRAIVTSIRNGVGPFHNVSTGGTHIHHLVWGILLLLLTGYLWLMQTNRTPGSDRLGMRLTAVLFGIGAALTLDEFALWLKLADVYFTPEGQKSIQAVIAFGAFLSIGIWGGPFFRGLFHFLFRRHPSEVQV